jgi:hypothetical protein
MVAEKETSEIRARIRAGFLADQKLRTDQRRERVQTMTARQAFEGSDPADTRAFLKRLEQVGVEGCLAAELFRCQKASSRAKAYHGEYRDMAYDRKAGVIDRLCVALRNMRERRWGWQEDPCQGFARWVLYVELPQGQVSFHALERGDGPEYPREWDRQHASEERILAFCDSVLARGVTSLAVAVSDSDAMAVQTLSENGVSDAPVAVELVCSGGPDVPSGV